MSRTYRHYEQWAYSAHGKIWSQEERDKVSDEEAKIYKKHWNLPCHTWHGFYRYDLKGKDKKPWNKPPKVFKVIMRRGERSKVKNAIRSGKEVIPIFKKSDMWNYT